MTAVARASDFRLEADFGHYAEYVEEGDYDANSIMLYGSGADEPSANDIATVRAACAWIPAAAAVGAAAYPADPAAP